LDQRRVADEFGGVGGDVHGVLSFGLGVGAQRRGCAAVSGFAIRE
jgi:hypothetical protein